MDATSNGHAKPPATTIQEAQAQLDNLQAQLTIKQVARCQKLLESSQVWDSWIGAYSDQLDIVRDAGQFLVPVSTPYDRRWGSNFPFWLNEQQLNLIRAPARILCTTNPHAIGLLTGLTSYIVGQGFTYRAAGKPGQTSDDGLVDAVQDEIDEFMEANEWSELEQELFWRSREDGEYFLRFFSRNGRLIVRTIEPEQVWQPPGSMQDEWSYGIQTDPEDVQSIVAYHASYLAGPGDHHGKMGEIIPAAEVHHHKENVKRTIKRGLTDFAFSTHEALEIADKLRRNLGEGAAVQAAIAGIRQHDQSSTSQVTAFANALTDFTRTDAVTGRNQNMAKIAPGTFLDMNKGQVFIAPPGAANALAHVEVLGALLRSAGVRWNAPQWLASADSGDAAFASSLTEESPFVKTGERKQQSYKRHWLQIIEHAVEVAIEENRLPTDTLDRVEIQCEAPTVQTRNKLEEAQENQIKAAAGVLSVQTWSQQDGLDYEQEQLNREEFNDRTGGQGDPLPLPDATGGDGALSGAGSGKPPKTPTAESLHEGKDASGHDHDTLGRFGSGGGGSPKKKDDVKQGTKGNADIHAKAADASKTWISRAKELPVKVWERAKTIARDKYAKLEARYGRPTALAIMGAGIVGTAIPIPGATLVATAPIVGVAEIYLRPVSTSTRTCA